MNSERFIEPLLQEDITRFTQLPIKFPRLQEAYETHESMFWTAKEIDYSADYDDWLKLNDNERYFIEHILAFFAGADGIVLENLLTKFVTEVKATEARNFYSFQGMMENIHSEVYSIQIDTLIKDEDEKNNLFNAISNIPCIKQKMEWGIKWLSNDTTFAKRLVSFAIMEGIFFSGSFCAIYWIKEQNLLPGLTMSNEFISRDEGLHCEFACLLYSKLLNKLDQQELHSIIKDAVEIEKKFITVSLPCSMIGMNSVLMTEYIEFVADRLANMLGYHAIYNSKNPFSFMDKISVDQKTNFFEKRVTEYSKVNNTSNFKIDVNIDF